MSWLTRIPSAIVRAYARMLPRLEAEETIDRANTTAFAVGRMEPDAARALATAWDQAAAEGRPRATPTPADRQTLAEMGIRVEVLTPTGAAAG